MGRSKDPEHTIELIVTAATQLFVQKGYEQTSIQDIMEKAGLSKGAVYHHFKSKEEILDAVLGQYSAYMENLLENMIETTEGANGREKMIRILERITADSGAREPDAMFFSMADNPKFLLAAMHNCVTQDAPAISRLLQAGIADGSIQTEYPLECTEMLLLLTNYWAPPTVLRRTAEECRRRLRFLQHTLRALGVDVLSDYLIQSILEIHQAAGGFSSNE